MVRLFALLWFLGLGLSIAMVLYAAPDFRMDLMTPPQIMSPGSIVHVMNLHFLVLMWGVLYFAFTVRLWRGQPGSPDARRLDLLARLRAESRVVTPYVLALSALPALDRLAGAVRYDRALGEGLYVGPVDLPELFASPLLLVLGLVVNRVAERAAPSREPAALDVAQPPGRGVMGFASIVAVLDIGLAVSGPEQWWHQDVHMEALSLHSGIWELLMLSMLLLCDDPTAAPRQLGSWIQRNLAPLRLLAALELFRIVSKQVRYHELQWLPGSLDHSTRELVFFSGRLHNVPVLLYVACLLLGAFAYFGRDLGRSGGDRA